MQFFILFSDPICFWLKSSVHDHVSQKSKANWIRKLKLLTVLLYLILLLIALKNFKNHINFANNNLHYFASISGLQ